jgi:hypothetical protein
MAVSPVGRLFLVTDTEEIARRRARLAGRLIEAWPDLYTPGEAWLGETALSVLEASGGPLAVKLSIDPAVVPVYYGPQLADVESLPLAESLLGRVLSAHGIAVAWITRDQFGERTHHEPRSPHDPIFYLRRPGGVVAHVWRLFRTRHEAWAYVAEDLRSDEEAQRWAERLAIAGWEELIQHHTRGR